MTENFLDPSDIIKLLVAANEWIVTNWRYKELGVIKNVKADNKMRIILIFNLTLV